MYQLEFPDFIPKFSIESQDIVNFIFYGALILSVVLSLVLFFHWRKYGFSKKVFAFTEMIYIIGCIIFISIAFLSLK